MSIQRQKSERKILNLSSMSRCYEHLVSLVQFIISFSANANPPPHDASEILSTSIRRNPANQYLSPFSLCSLTHSLPPQLCCAALAMRNENILQCQSMSCSHSHNHTRFHRRVSFQSRQIFLLPTNIFVGFFFIK